MRVLVLTATQRLPDFSSFYRALGSHVQLDLRLLDKAAQRNLQRSLHGVDLASYQRIILDLPFKNIHRQAGFLAGLSGLLIYEQDACQNYLPSSRWHGHFSRFYRYLPSAKVVVTGASVARRLSVEGVAASFVVKGYDPDQLYLEGVERDIELGFIGRTASAAYAGRKALLDQLADCEPLQLLRTEPGADYRRMLNRIQVFISADVGLQEYMAKNFEAMACGCILLAWRQGEEEEAIGLCDGQHLLLYSSLEQLREHLRKLREQPDWAVAVAEAGRDFAVQHLGFPAMAARLAELLEQPWLDTVPLSIWRRLWARWF